MNIGFLITAYNQLKCVKFTIATIRKWKKFADCPIVLVISGDENREVFYKDDDLTRVVHLDDMVGDDFNGLVATSIMRQINHGMIEMDDLERDNQIDYVVHMHGDILLLSEDGVEQEIEKFAKSGKLIGCDPVGAQRSDYIYFDGHEIMPQLFVVDNKQAKEFGYMRHMTIDGDLEKRSTEWALIGNLARSTGCIINKEAFDKHAHVICRGRQQWGLHNHWGGWTHFGNQMHLPVHELERRNEAVLRSHGIDMFSWDN